MLDEALAFPRADDDWLETVLIGGVLSLLGFLVVPTIIVNGYLLRVMRAAVAGDATPPRFGDWADLFVDGLLLWIVQFVYMGIPAALLATVMASFAVVASVGASTGADPTGAATAAGGLVALLVLLAVGLLFVVATYLLPAALANFARTGEFAAAFHLRTVARAAFSVDYLVAVLLVIVVSLVLGLVGGLLVVVLVGIFVLFYLQMVVYHLFGQGFARGLGLEGTGEPSADPAG
ncbi:MAG: DUF4013 domain-containing protein [Halobacteriales archaeon]